MFYVHVTLRHILNPTYFEIHIKFVTGNKDLVQDKEKRGSENPNALPP